ncbi:unnamed protein product [Ascophyllum nodosum]
MLLSCLFGYDTCNRVDNVGSLAWSILLCLHPSFVLSCSFMFADKQRTRVSSCPNRGLTRCLGRAQRKYATCLSDAVRRSAHGCVFFYHDFYVLCRVLFIFERLGGSRQDHVGVSGSVSM